MAFNLADLFEVVVDTVPDRVALVAGDVRLTYRQLDERANRAGHALLDAGVRTGEWIGIHSWNRAEWIESMLGAYKARLVPVNVNYRYVAEELRYLLDNADVVAAVHEPEFGPLLDELRPALPKLRHLLEIGRPYEDALAAASPGRDFESRSADDLYVLYTGGTTGMPKGVLWRQEDIFFAALGGGGFGQPPITAPEELAERIGPEETRGVQIVNAPMMHGGGQWVSFISFFAGGTVVLNTAHGFDGHEVWRLAEREKATSIMVVGDAMARPLAEALTDGAEEHDTSSVFMIGSGGAILSAGVRAQLQEQLPHAFIADSFGASETGAAGTVLQGAGPRFTVNEQTTVIGDDLRPVEPGSGVVGRLARRGHIPLRYHKDESKTAATIVTAPDGTRWVVPGDYATVDADGTLVLLGRGSQCINTGGEKVYPEEVEAALKSHPDVFDAVVVGVPDDRFVERVAALVQPRRDAEPTLEALQEHCRRSIAGYKVPRQLRLVDELLRTPVGKPDYRWAKAQLAH